MKYKILLLILNLFFYPAYAVNVEENLPPLPSSINNLEGLQTYAAHYTLFEILLGSQTINPENNPCTKLNNKNKLKLVETSSIRLDKIFETSPGGGLGKKCHYHIIYPHLNPDSEEKVNDLKIKFENYLMINNSDLLPGYQTIIKHQNSARLTNKDLATEFDHFSHLEKKVK